MFQYISGKLISGTLHNFVFLWMEISSPALRSTSLLLLSLCMRVFFVLLLWIAYSFREKSVHVVCFRVWHECQINKSLTCVTFLHPKLVLFRALAVYNEVVEQSGGIRIAFSKQSASMNGTDKRCHRRRKRYQSIRIVFTMYKQTVAHENANEKGKNSDSSIYGPKIRKPSTKSKWNRFSNCPTLRSVFVVRFRVHGQQLIFVVQCSSLTFWLSWKNCKKNANACRKSKKKINDCCRSWPKLWARIGWKISGVSHDPSKCKSRRYQLPVDIRPIRHVCPTVF